MPSTLNKIASEYAILENEGEQNKLRYLQYARNAVRELSITLVDNIKSVMLDLDDQNSALLPDDYLRYSKVGICIHGHIIEFDRDESLCKYEKADDFCKPCGTKVTAAEQVETNCACACSGEELPFLTSTYLWNNIYYNGQWSAHYAVPAHKKVGVFKIVNNRIYIDSLCDKYSGKVVLEYKSTGVNMTDTTYVPDELIPAITAYIRYHNELDKKGNMALAYKEEYRRQFNIYKNFKIKVSLKQIVNTHRQKVFQAHIPR
ncbi:MAG: hypothetical protein U0T69_11500 [Chitinophagales bacterium]